MQVNVDYKYAFYRKYSGNGGTCLSNKDGSELGLDHHVEEELIDKVNRGKVELLSRVCQENLRQVLKSTTSEPRKGYVPLADSRFLYKFLNAGEEVHNKAGKAVTKKVQTRYEQLKVEFSQEVDQFFAELAKWRDAEALFHISPEFINHAIEVVETRVLAHSCDSYSPEVQFLSNLLSLDVKSDIRKDLESINPGVIKCAELIRESSSSSLEGLLVEKINKNRINLTDIPKKHLLLAVDKIAARYTEFAKEEVEPYQICYEHYGYIPDLVFLQEILSAEDELTTKGLIERETLDRVKRTYNTLKDFAIKNLIQVMKSEDPELKELNHQAVEALGKIRDPKAQAFLIQLLEDLSTKPENFNRQICAAYTLCRQGYASSVKPLAVFVNKLIDEDAERNSTYYENIIVGVGIEIKGQEATEFLISFLEHPNDKVKLIAIDALNKRKDTRAVNPLTRLLKYTNAEIQYKVSKTLENLGDPSAVEPLIELSRTSNSQFSNYWGDKVSVQPAAIHALGRMKDPRAIEPLKQIIIGQDKVEEETLIVAIQSLANLGGEDTAQFLVGLLNTPVIPVKVAVVNALGKTKDTRAVSPLIDILKSGSSLDIKTEAAVALGEINDPASIEPLQKFLNELVGAQKVVKGALNKMQ